MTAIQKPDSFEVFQRINEQLYQSADVSTILTRLYQNPQQFFQNIHTQIFEVFQHEHQFQMQEIVKIAEEQQNQLNQNINADQQQFDFLETYTLNSDIFKQSIMVIMGLLVDDIHKYFNQGVQQAVNNIKYGDQQIAANPELQRKVEEQKQYYLQQLQNQNQGQSNGDITPSQFHASLGSKLYQKNNNLHCYSPENARPRDNTQVSKTLNYLKQFYGVEELEENKLMKNAKFTPVESQHSSQQRINVQEQLDIAHKISQYNNQNGSQQQQQQQSQQQSRANSNFKNSNSNSNRQSQNVSIQDNNNQQQQQSQTFNLQQQQQQQSPQQQQQSFQQQQQQQQQLQGQQTGSFMPIQSSLKHQKSNKKSNFKNQDSEEFNQTKIEQYGKIKNENEYPVSFQTKGGTFSRSQRLPNNPNASNPGVGFYDLPNTIGNSKDKKQTFGKQEKTSIFQESVKHQQGPDTMYDPKIRFLSSTNNSKQK